jgi:hypothetical protein
VNPNWKTNLHYVNTSCYTLPKAPADPALASQCVPFAGKGAVQFPGTCSNLLGNSGRNSLTGPGLVNLDFSVFKNFPVKKITESFNVQFRAEFFNILNHANFQPPLAFSHGGSSALFNIDGTSIGKGGVLDSTVGQPSARDIQFALKILW